MPPIYDDYNDEYDISSPPTIEEKIRYDYNMPPKEVSLAQLAMGVDVEPRHPGSNPHGCEFGFLLFIKKTRCGGLPHRFPFK
jgi:hypothetical protein